MLTSICPGPENRLGAAFALAIVVSATGCATTGSMTQAELKFLETREIDLPYPQAYDAALNAMFSLGLQLTHSDKGSGVISGQSGDYVMRSTLKRSKQKKHPVKKVSLLVSDRGPRLSQLRMKVLINEEQQIDRKLMTRIWQRIEREAMLDTRPARAVNKRPRRR
jgi:hypothetical protein